MIRCLLAVYLSVLAFLSLNPWIKPSGAAAVAGIGWDKIDHALAYGGLTVLLFLAQRGSRRWSLALVALAASAIGILTEFCQAWFATGRMFSSFDVYANGAGALLGALGLLGVRWLLQARG